METIITYLRQIVGTADFSSVVDGTTVINYSAMTEYIIASLIVLIVISNIFRFLRLLCK